MASTDVTLITTAATPLLGTAPRPRTNTDHSKLPGSAPTPAYAPSTVACPARVSSSRAGTSEVYPSPTAPTTSGLTLATARIAASCTHTTTPATVARCLIHDV